MKRSPCYALRLLALSQVVVSASSFFLTSATVIAADRSVCYALAANKPTQTVHPLKNADVDHVNDQLKRANVGLYFDVVTDVYRVDIDNDGKLDNVALTVAGTAHSVGFVIYDEKWKERTYKWKSPLDGSDESVRWSEFAFMVRDSGRTYLVWKDGAGRSLSFVSVFEKDLHQLLCKFAYSPEATTTIIKAKDRRLCNAVLRGKVAYGQFDRLTDFPFNHCFDGGGPACASAGGNSALIDINNDGKPENVVQMGVAWGGGRGCDFEFLAIADLQGTSIPKSPLNHVLAKATQKWGICGGATSLPFRYGAAWYIENKHSAKNVFDYYNVIQLRGTHVEEVCRYSVTRTPHVVE